ncbi:MAG: outer membrane lipoprotein carrier protein LolA [Candidatus Acidiferrales bacterium]
MMRRLIRIVFVLTLCLAGAGVGLAQDANKIIEQYLKAAGGNKSISRIQTVSIDGAFSNGSEAKPGTFTFRAKQPNRYYTEIQSEGKTLIESYNGKSAWHQTENGEIATLLGPQALEMEAASQYYNARLQALAKRKIGVAFKGPARVRGRDALQLELTYPTGVQWEVYFDPQTHLIAEEKTTIAGIPRDIFYDDYRNVDGVKLPYKLEVRRGHDTYAVNVTRAAVNETVGERVFDFPKKSQVQLPDLKKLFEEIDANQKQIDKIKENYAGTNVEEETEFDKTGKVTKTEAKEYTFFYLNGDEVSTLVKKDDKPLSDDEQKKENEKTRKRIEEIQKNEKKKEAKEEKAKEEGKEAKEDDEPGIEIFLRVSQFVNPRRERFRGQDVLVFDFEPNPEYKPKNMAERVVKELAGVVWVDEKAHDVARLEAYFVGDVRIAGGLLANLQKGTSFSFEQAYLNNEVWLPTYVEAHLGVRVLLVKGFKVNVVNRYSDYKRFNVETLSTINKPKEPLENAPKP